jgi:hypothetical protein
MEFTLGDVASVGSWHEGIMDTFGGLRGSHHSDRGESCHEGDRETVGDLGVSHQGDWR